jgi:hypothetical protein
MTSTNLNYNENFSLTYSLTIMTNNWYQNTKADNASYGTLFLGSIGSRLVNILITPAAFIDTISHLFVGIFTLGLAAPAGKIYNFIQWNFDSNLRSKFSFAGGIINFMNAKKHFDASLGTLAGVISPEKIVPYFSTQEGRTQKEIDDIFQNEIARRKRFIAEYFNGPSESSKKTKAAYENVITVLQNSSKLNIRTQNTSLEAHEEFSFTRSFTNMTNSWYQKTKNVEASLETLIIGSIASRIANVLIIPLALIDSISNVAIGIFTLILGAPLGKIYNAVQWCRHNELRSRFSFAGGIINIMNAKNHLINAPLATLAGTLNPEKAAYFFKTSQRKTKEESNFPLTDAIKNLNNLKTLDNSNGVKIACEYTNLVLNEYLIH